MRQRKMIPKVSEWDRGPLPIKKKIIVGLFLIATSPLHFLWVCFVLISISIMSIMKLREFALMSFLWAIIGSLAVITIGFSIAIHLLKKMKKKILIFAVSCLLPVYAFEVSLAAVQYILVKQHKEFYGIKETRLEAANRLSVKLSPNGRWFIEYGIPLPKNYPIGTHPNERVLGFKEGDGDEWPIHKTDRFGYFNKNEWWDDEPTIMIVGDSFVTAEHLHTNSITQSLRALGLKAVNVGLTGCGPLTELAALKTQWSIVSNSVRTIVWIFYDGNDMEDAIVESNLSEYRKVLNDNYRHNPNPDLLNVFNFDDSKLYGSKYAVVSILSLKRVRRMVQSGIFSNSMGIYYLNRSLEQAQKLNTNLILVGISKPGGSTLKEWDLIKAPVKVRFPSDKTYYTGDGHVQTHLGAKGYNHLAQILNSRIHD